MPVIDIQNATFGYAGHEPVMKDFSLQIGEGESVGLIGANGTGKSTLLKMLTGIVNHTGSVKVLDMELEKANFGPIRSQMGLVFQDSDSQLFMPTVYDDIAFFPRNMGYSAEQVEQAVDMALQRIGIEHLKHKQNYKMSGGEKRMACIAVVLAMQPKILLMDEPSIALDPCNRRTLINNLNALSETKLIASHDLDMILETCSRVIVMDQNGIRADGPTEQILRNEPLLTDCRLELPFCYQTPRVYLKG